MRAAIITADTLAYKTKDESAAAAVIKRLVEQVGFQVVFNAVLPEDEKVLATVMERLADGELVDVILTTGSTGVQKKDCVPEATRDVVERLVPGIPDAIRTYNIRYSKRAMLDRATAGIRGKTLIVNLPDTAKMVKEGLEYVMPELVHATESLK